MRVLFGYQMASGVAVFQPEEKRVVEIVLNTPSRAAMAKVAPLLQDRNYGAIASLITRIRRHKKDYELGKASTLLPANPHLAITSKDRVAC